MSKRVYKLTEGGMHDRFQRSHAKVQFLGGGFGNGKTAGVCVKALRLARDYPGSNGLIARSTYPKLNDTIRREFFKWCPQSWIKRAPTKDDNTCYLTNGSVVNFRYVAQQGKTTEESKSNLLSATYDWIIVDQIEDPEFSHKDFMDLMGRLRGNADYIGDDDSMPRVGPRWMMLTSNPTRNWVYRKLVRPVHDFAKGAYNPDLLCEVDDEGNPVLVDGKPVPIIEMFEGSTYENVDNVGEDYIRGMMSTYTGSMRQRFIFGEWGALSGLVYPQFDETQHVLSHEVAQRYLHELRMSGFTPTFLEAYDHGLAVPSCYILAFVDDDGNVVVLDGHYGAEGTVEAVASAIHTLRDAYEVHDPAPVYADPQLFRRTTGSRSSVGATVAGLFAAEGIEFQRGANDIGSGVAKVAQYLSPRARHEHPIYGTAPAPTLYVSDKCPWWVNEVTEYYWARDGSDDLTDKPRDKNDHAMDATKYLLTARPKLARFTGKPNAPPAWMQWHEIERKDRTTLPRHR